MKTWQYASAAGGLEKNLQLKWDVPEPFVDQLSKDKILVEGLYASLNPADYKLPEILSPINKILKRVPAVPCMDFCGRVKSVHKSNETMKDGDLVFGSLGMPSKNGTLSQYFIAPVATCVKVPAGLKPEDAASIPVAGVTAYQSLAPYIKTGQKVFINGGSGGCGVFGIQIAKNLGAEVTVSCSTRNVELCKDLGAHEVIDYTQCDLVEELKKKGQVFDHVVDNVGLNAELFKCVGQYTKPDARFIQVGAPASIQGVVELVRNAITPGCLGGGKRKLVPMMMKINTKDLTLLGEWMAEGKIKSVIDEMFAFKDAAKAFEKLKTGHARGKIIVEVADTS